MVAHIFSRTTAIALVLAFTAWALTALTPTRADTHHSHPVKAGDLAISAPWIRASVPGQTNGAGYLHIAHHGQQDDRLLAVQSEAAERIELHTVVTENGMARMRQVHGIPLAAGKKTALVPGGYHVMFMKLKAPFQAGQTVAATLQFERAGVVAIRFTVQPATYRPEGQSGKHDAGHGHDHNHDHAHAHGHDGKHH